MTKIELTLEEFLDEVKTEIIVSGENGEDLAEEWLKGFTELLAQDKLKNPETKDRSGVISVLVKDEGEVFDYADEYCAAVDSGQIDKYWAWLSKR
jgi:hypothetical protein